MTDEQIAEALGAEKTKHMTADALQARQEALAQYTEPTLHDALVEMANEVGIEG